MRGRFYLYAGLAGVMFIGLAHEQFWERISTLTAVTDEQKELDNSAMSRIVLVKAQLKMFANYPLGAGHKGTAELSPDYLDERFLTVNRRDPNARAARSSHNTFMSVLVDQGIVGAVLLTMIMVWVFRTMSACRRAFKDDPPTLLLLTAVVGALAVVVVSGQFSPYLKAEIQYWMFGLLMCVSALASRTEAAAATQASNAADARRDAIAGTPGHASAAVHRMSSRARFGGPLR